MTLPASGTISMSQINVELGRAATAALSLNDAAARALAGVPSGPIKMSDFYGKSNIVVVQRQTTSTTVRASATVVSWAAAVAGNLLVIEFACEQNAVGPTTPAGWTAWPSGNVGLTGSGGQFNIFYKIATAGETSVTISHGNNRVCTLMREINGGTNAIAFATPVTVASSAAPDPPSITPAAGKLVIAGCWSQLPAVTGYSAGYTNGLSAQSGGSGLQCGSAQKIATASPEDPGVMALASATPVGTYTYTVS